MTLCCETCRFFSVVFEHDERGFCDWMPPPILQHVTYDADRTDNRTHKKSVCSCHEARDAR